jgi:hypothetical protein
MVLTMDDVKHIQVDAESHLELVRELDIRSTPTTISSSTKMALK